MLFHNLTPCHVSCCWSPAGTESSGLRSNSSHWVCRLGVIREMRVALITAAVQLLETQKCASLNFPPMPLFTLRQAVSG